ncbi:MULTISPECIES: endopeptidase La [unclassified Desulfovibrio]|uniref:endopeptidase La n=1 Tax=unclassified Desulfovibrio TaxID=2593640 RepID=UPI0013EAB6EE|nr:MULTISPECIES: endopeptidase La [unclassified Desulfovibrio]
MTEDTKDPAIFPDGAEDLDAARTAPAADAAPGAAAAPGEGDGPAADRPLPPVLPVLPVRDVVVFNYMILPLFISREKSVRAVEAAVRRGRQLLVVAQREEGVEDPGPADLYQTGTVVQVMRMLKMPDGRIKVLVQGVSRARVAGYRQAEPFLEARVEHVAEAPVPAGADVEALLRSVREQSEKVLSLRGISSPDILGVLQGVDDPGRLADIIAANLHMKMAEAQAILEAGDPLERLRLVHERLQHELEVATVQARIQGAAREGMDKAQKEYFLREQLKAIRHELGDGEDDADDDLASLKAALDKAGLSGEARTEADRQLRRLSTMHADSSEASVLRSYLEWLADLPWKKQSRDRLDIARARDILDEDHCGLEKVKERILEFLSVRKLNPRSKGSILCFSGPPGVGKTSLGRSIARALGRKFQRLSLGGMHDEAEIRGHRRTYIGAMPGRILQALRQAGTRNPVMVLDEVDKLGADFRGDPSSALLEVLDPEQNNTFSDHYLNVPFDLSRVLFICTANHVDSIPAALRDRMEVITLPGYTRQEKAEIGKRHLLPKRVEDTGLKEGDVRLSDAALDKIIAEYTREAGVRNLERELGAVCRKLARRKAQGAKGPFRVSPAEVEKLLGAPRFLEDESEAELEPGMALGLAWTPAGGEVLTVEASAVKGKGALLLTGQLGDVMKESAQAAMSYIRSRADVLGLDPAFAARRDIHIHVPAGATPKDGPSAGVTLTTALISALTGQPARADLCMTGEITLRGRVLPVGGIKEKILAGVARGLRHVIIPHQNVKDLEDVPRELLKRIKVHPVRKYDEVLSLAFAGGALAGNSAKPASTCGEKAPAEKKRKEAVPPAPPRRRAPATRLPDRPSA